MARGNLLRKEQKKNHKLYVSLIIAYILLSLLFFLVSAKYIDFEKYINTNRFLNIYTDTIKSMRSRKISIDFSYIKTAIYIFKNTVPVHMLVIGGIALLWIGKPYNEWRGMEQASGKIAGKYTMQKYIDPSQIPIADNVYVSIESHKYKGKMQQAPSNLNQLLIAGSGAGKTLRMIIPQIMACIGNYVVTDGKGELFRYTSKYMREKGYETIALNFYDIIFSHGYNPFQYIHSEQDVLDVSELYMKATTDPDKKDFWTESAKLVFSTIMLYLYNTPDEIKTIGRALDLVSTLKHSEQRGIDMSSEYAMVMMEYCAKEEHYKDMVYLKWQDIQSIPSATLGGQISTLTTALQLFYTKDVKNLTSIDQMHFENFADPNKKTILYVIIPPAKTTYKAITSLFFSQLFSELQYMANSSPTMALPNLLQLLLDEFINLGPIADIGIFTSVIRSYNIRALYCIQNLKQLKETYKKEYSTIISNCAIQTALGSIDDDKDESLSWLSNKLGSFNVRVETRSYNFGDRGGGTDQNSIIKRNYDPVELKRYFKLKPSNKRYGGDCIVFIENEDPIAAHKFDTLHNETYRKYIGYKIGEQVKNNTDIKEYLAEQHVKLEQEYERNLELQRQKDKEREEKYPKVLLDQIEAIESEAEESIDSDEKTVNDPVTPINQQEENADFDVDDIDEDYGEPIDLDDFQPVDEDMPFFDEE